MLCIVCSNSPGTGDFRGRRRADAVRHGPLPSPDGPVAGRCSYSPPDSLPSREERGEPAMPLLLQKTGTPCGAFRGHFLFPVSVGDRLSHRDRPFVMCCTRRRGQASRNMCSPSMALPLLVCVLVFSSYVRVKVPPLQA